MAYSVCVLMMCIACEVPIYCVEPNISARKHLRLFYNKKLYLIIP
uniref:Uncharacterized protein n=1 Tax=Anguilla anguilla TaxID=7936 RepID=A0A0E9QV58_ANGAN